MARIAVGQCSEQSTNKTTETMQILSNIEITELIEALDAWESQESQAAMMSEMLGAMITPKGEREDEWKAKMEARMMAVKRNGMARRERSILLKAKLIQMRNRQSEHELTPA